MKKYLRSLGILIMVVITSSLSGFSQSVFINEIHYDNASTDTGEAIEIAGPAGTDLTGWSIVLYNGSNGAVYGTTILSGTLADLAGGYGFLTVDYPSNGIQNGSPDGMALVDASNNVIQFLSYEGEMTAIGGPADGMISTDIGVSESGTGAIGNSLQLSGTGTDYSDFTWQGEAPNTFGSVNTGQDFSSTSAIPSQPTNLLASNTTQTTTDLSWNASTDDVGVTGYQILDGATQIGTTTDTNFHITGLTAGTNYTFKVVALDGDGNSSAPAEISVLTLSAAVVMPGSVFINEIHYDNTGTDAGEEIEIAGPAGTDLTGWSIVLYNGNGGAAYNTTGLSGTLTDMSDGYGFVTVSYPVNGIQNGSPDGMALVDASNNVMQFLSYEGTFTAVGGPADGMVSEDIGVAESGSGAIGNSLQLSGTGSLYSDFTWMAESPNTFGTVNAGQSFVKPVPNVFVNEIHYDNEGTDTGEGIEVAGTAGTDLSGWSLVLYNGNGGAAYDMINLSGVIPDQDNGYGTMAFDAPGIQNGSPDGLALVDPEGAVIQFLSYEGTFMAVGGPADGMTSEDIGVTEGSSTPVGYSLQLTGNGTTYGDFTWSSPMANTLGDVNTNQSFGGTTPPVGEVISIAEARLAPAGTTVMVKGVLTVADQFAGPAYMQDETAGIAVYDAQVYGPGNFSIGDEITVTGTLTLFNGLLEITSVSAVTPNGLPENPIVPVEITLAEMPAHPSELVKIVDAAFPTPGDILFGNTNFALTDASGPGEMRLDGDVTDLVGLAQPDACEVTGVVSLYKDIYQLMPRLKSDLPCAIPFTSDDGLGISKDYTLDIATWNLEWFGDEANSPAGASADEVQKNHVKAVLSVLDADIYAVEEVSDDAVFAQMVSEMNGYDYVLSDYTSYPNDPGVKQKVGFIYKTSTVHPVETRPLLARVHPYYNGGDGSALVGYPVDDHTRFYASGRLPFMMVADITINGVTNRYNIVDIHARANNSNDAVLTYEMRKYDVEVLKDSLDAQFSDANIILLGDYNDDVDETVANVPTTVSSYASYVGDPDNYLPVTGSLSAAGYRSYVTETNMIDHITISNELFGDYIEGSARVHYEFYSSDYTQTTSDHFPVTARFQVQPIEIVMSGDKVVYPAYQDSACTTLSVLSVSGGIGNLSYEWSTGETSGSITVCPTEETVYTLTVRDEAGSEATASVTVSTVDVLCTTGNGMDKIQVCYHGKTMCVAYPAVDELLRNGAVLGACPGEETPPVEVTLDNVKVYPNPFRNDFKIAFNSDNEAEAQILIRTSEGVLVNFEAISIHAGNNIKHINMQGLASGSYFASIVENGRILDSRQVTKQ